MKRGKFGTPVFFAHFCILHYINDLAISSYILKITENYAAAMYEPDEHSMLGAYLIHIRSQF